MINRIQQSDEIVLKCELWIIINMTCIVFYGVIIIEKLIRIAKIGF